MRGPDLQQHELFSYKTLEERGPADHPPRLVLVNGILNGMDAEFDRLHSAIGRPSIPPERRRRASRLQIFYTVRSERPLMEPLDFNRLFRWFVGLGMDEGVWDHSTFTHNRDRLLTEALTREFFSRVVAQGYGLTSDEHVSVDGTLVEAWASHKSFKPKAGGGPGGGSGRDPEVDFKGEKRSNETHASTPDPEARLYKQAEGQTSKLCDMAHGLIENRNGLIVDADVSLSTGTAEREAALEMARRSLPSEGATLGADKAYDTYDFVADPQATGVAPRIAQNITARRDSAVPAAVAATPGYAVSLRVRKRIEQVFGWGKMIGLMRKTKLRGRTKVAAQTLLGFAAHHLVRMRKLLTLAPLPVTA
jgi:transposase